MGFAIKSPKVSAPAAVETAPPVVAEAVEDNTASAYDQKRANRRGLLSTILSRNNSGGALTSRTQTGNTTLG
ncbi:MAG: hypothetical protein J1E42_03305 [Akkermansiaceae bacterium]|nr:hypothetical protein [Akkermansiaceae bacterium]